MQKHDKMVALAKEKSAEMTETAITAIETMYRKNIKIILKYLLRNFKLYPFFNLVSFLYIRFNF